MEYKLTPADKAPVPASYFSEPRYLGYRGDDYKKPYAHFFTEKVAPLQPHVKEGKINGPVAGALGPRLSRLADEMSKPGYQALETGFTTNEDGQLVVCALTHMPDVTPDMWDWWLWWHAIEPQRYKLWHPESHVFSVITDDRSHIKGLSHRERSWRNTYYINEYLGEEYASLKAGVLNPADVGFDTSKTSETFNVSRGGLNTAPIAALWIIHQVRETPDGSEMRSRFFFNDMRVWTGATARSVTTTAGKLLTIPGVSHLANAVVSRTKPAKLHEFGPALLQHCGEEMNQLGTILPKLYAEFGTESGT